MRKATTLFTVLTLFIIGLSGCKDELSKEEAKEKIADYLNTKGKYEAACNILIRDHWGSDYRGDEIGRRSYYHITDEQEKVFTELSQKGFLLIDTATIQKDGNVWLSHTIRPTESTKKYLLNNEDGISLYATSVYEIDRVIDIYQEKESNVAKVEYKIKLLERTPFYVYETRCYKDTTSSNFIELMKYEDGWKVKR